MHIDLFNGMSGKAWIEFYLIRILALLVLSVPVYSWLLFHSNTILITIFFFKFSNNINQLMYIIYYIYIILLFIKRYNVL